MVKFIYFKHASLHINNVVYVGTICVSVPMTMFFCVVEVAEKEERGVSG